MPGFGDIDACRPVLRSARRDGAGRLLDGWPVIGGDCVSLAEQLAELA